MNLEFENQSFRQEGHEKESPQKFLGRRIKMVRILANTDDGGPLEVFLVMCRAPLVWSTILVLENIHSSEDLFGKVNDHYLALIDAVKRESSDTVTINNLASTLRRMGFTPNHNARRANLTSADATIEEVPEPDKDLTGAEVPREETSPQESDGSTTIRQVYQTFKKRQWPPPKGGYPFPKADHVTTQMGRAPPSSCKVCGSPNHWDKECPNWNVYIEKQKRGVLLVTSGTATEELEMLYHSAYCVLLEGRVNEPSL
jgi:hypothetical protein